MPQEKSWGFFLSYLITKIMNEIQDQRVKILDKAIKELTKK